MQGIRPIINSQLVILPIQLEKPLLYPSSDSPDRRPMIRMSLGSHWRHILLRRIIAQYYVSLGFTVSRDTLVQSRTEEPDCH
jgi:hypothetical protein